MKTIVKYVKKNGKVLGCLVGIGYDGLENYAIGWSKYNRSGVEDKPFSKKKALEIATGRALNSSTMFIGGYINFPNSFCAEIDDFVSRCKRYFKDNNPPRNWRVRLYL